MRPLKVVMLNEQRHPTLAILEVRKYGARQKLLPHRLPEPLNLSAGLRMMRATLHMRDPLPTQLPLKLRRASPGGILSSLIGQDLPRCSILGNPARQSLQHQCAALMMRHTQTHQITRVIIQKCRHVHPLVSSQQEREQIRLPQLIRLGTLESMRGGLWLLAHRRPRLHDSLGVQHPAHGRLGGSDPQKALHQIPYPPRPGLRLLRLRRQDRLPAHLRAPAAATLGARWRPHTRLQ